MTMKARAVAMRGLQFPANGEAIHVGQQQIEQHKIGRSGLGQAQTLAARAGAVDGEPLALQDEGQAFP